MKPTAKRVKIIRRSLKKGRQGHQKQNVPYDTGKVKIGLLYVPPAPRMDADAEKIQAGLMGWPLSLERRVADWVNRSPWSLIGAVGIILIAISFMKGCAR